MSCIICPHWIPEHAGPEDAERFARWRPPYVKIITTDDRIPHAEYLPVGATLVVRSHPMSENWESRGIRDMVHAREMAAKHVEYLRQLDANRPPGHSAVYELLNEPHLWADEPPVLLAEYTREALVRAHAYALRLVVGCFGVGWPGNGGVDGAPVDWAFFRPAIEAMRPGDYLGLHEYWGLESPGQNWRWWAGRYLQCSYPVDILVTECGIDTGVTGVWFGGWHDLPGSFDQRADRYMGELAWYETQCQTDGRIKGIFPFTYDYASNHWEKFNNRNEQFMRALFWHQEYEHMTVTPPPDPEPEPEPEPPPAGDIRELLIDLAWQRQSVPRNPQSAFFRVADAYELGAPMGPEERTAGYAWQAYAGGIVYCREGDWSNVDWLPWTWTDGHAAEAPAAVALLGAHPIADPALRRVTQLWGARPEYYARYSYGGVALRGHNGIDFGLPVGSRIVAAAGGRVAEAQEDPGGWGVYVKLIHAWGETLYAHLSALEVAQGDTVTTGDLLGLSGNTGNSTGPHLHFGMRQNPYVRNDGWGGYCDPAPGCRLKE